MPSRIVVMVSNGEEELDIPQEMFLEAGFSIRDPEEVKKIKFKRCLILRIEDGKITDLLPDPTREQFEIVRGWLPNIHLV